MPKPLLFIKNKFKALGPGFITGAADDDPSGVATYSIAGAKYGYKLNWLSLFLIPMMIAIQEMCGRIGMCAGMGLAGVIRKYHSKSLLYFAVSLLLIANTINISADLGVMAASLKMLFGLPFMLWLVVITVVTLALEIFVSYRKYSVYLKWMGLTLLVYVITAFITKQDWVSVARFTIIPHIEFNADYLMTMVGFIGTTISPYLFFWQASEEVEEEIIEGKVKEFKHKPRINIKDVLVMKRDTTIGMIFSNIVTMCIVLTTTATLFAHGVFTISTPQEAALALKPFAGNFAYILFAFGIISIGFQSVPILAGGVGYAFSESFGFSEGLGKKVTKAKAFYAVIAIATLFGALFNIIGINPIQALYYAAIINGVISIPLIFIIIRLADDEKIVGSYKTGTRSKIIAWITFGFVGLSSIFMIANLLR